MNAIKDGFGASHQEGLRGVITSGLRVVVIILAAGLAMVAA